MHTSEVRQKMFEILSYIDINKDSIKIAKKRGCIPDIYISCFTYDEDQISLNFMEDDIRALNDKGIGITLDIF